MATTSRSARRSRMWRQRTDRTGDGRRETGDGYEAANPREASLSEIKDPEGFPSPVSRLFPHLLGRLQHMPDIPRKRARLLRRRGNVID